MARGELSCTDGTTGSSKLQTLLALRLDDDHGTVYLLVFQLPAAVNTTLAAHQPKHCTSGLRCSHTAASGCSSAHAISVCCQQPGNATRPLVMSTIMKNEHNAIVPWLEYNHRYLGTRQVYFAAAAA